jgi:hypothetical protein
MAFQRVALTSIAFACQSSSSSSSPASRKRGLGFGGNLSCDDAELLNLADSHSYNWQSASPSQCGNGLSAEFVPMVVGTKCASIGKTQCDLEIEKAIARLDNDETRAKWKASNAQFLLGYNEPDAGNGKHNHPHEASPADAAAAWPKIQALAAAMSPPLVLVSPSVASGHESGGADCWDANGRSTWMDDFFGNCTHVVKDCDPSLIKYIGMHDYHGSVEMLRLKVDGAAKRYGRKIWITEIAMTNWGNPPQRSVQDAYLKELLPYLDSSENVFRYNWFAARNCPNDQNGGSNLLACDGSAAITSTGEIYRDAPDDAAVQDITV